MTLLENTKRKIILNAGHWIPGDSGAVCERCGLKNEELQEANLTIKIRDALLPMLQSYNFDVTAIPDDRDLRHSIDISRVAALGLNDGFAIDIHLNSRGYSQTGEIRGCEVYSGVSPTYEAISRVLSRNLAGIAQIPDRGYKPHTAAGVGSLGWITQNNCWAVVIECLYLDNPADRAILLRPDGPKKIADGIMRGILELYGMKSLDEPEITQEQLNILQRMIDILRVQIAALILKWKGRLGKIKK